MNTSVTSAISVIRIIRVTNMTSVISAMKRHVHQSVTACPPAVVRIPGLAVPGGRTQDYDGNG